MKRTTQTQSKEQGSQSLKYYFLFLAFCTFAFVILGFDFALADDLEAVLNKGIDSGANPFVKVAKNNYGKFISLAMCGALWKMPGDLKEKGLTIATGGAVCYGVLTAGFAMFA